VHALNGFAKAMKLLSRDPAYEEVVATHLKP
jgi:hypothetical protein